MNISFYSKTHTASDDMKAYAEKKIEKIERHFDHGDIHGQVEISEDTSNREKGACYAEATLKINRFDFRASSHGHTYPEAIDLMVKKIKRQVEKKKARQ